MTNPEYWYNTRTGEVEKGRQSAWTDVMGPYPTQEAARNALKTAAQRSENFDAAEEAWEDEWDDS